MRYTFAGILGDDVKTLQEQAAYAASMAAYYYENNIPAQARIWENASRRLKQQMLKSAGFAGLGKLLDPALGIKVKLEKTQASTGVTYYLVSAVDAVGVPVGKVDIWPSPGHPGAYEAGTLKVEEAYRRKGVATAMYQAFQQRTGHRLVPSKYQSAQGRAFWKGARARGHLSAMPPGFDAFDVFGPQDDAPSTPGQLFSSSPRGYVFSAGGRQWKVVHDYLGPGKRIVAPVEPRQVRVGGNFQQEGVYYAELVDGVLVVSNVAKRGEFRPVGKPVLKEKLGGLRRRK